MSRAWRHVVRAALLGAASAGPAAGQATSGSPGSTIAGGALGAYSGLLLGMMGSAVPCAQVRAAVSCTQISAGTTAAAAAVAGALLGGADEQRIRRMSRNAGIGAAGGALVGVGLARFTQRVGLRDVAALGLVGGAVGSVPRGAVIGLAIGGAAAGLLFAVADLDFPDAIAVAAAGLAVGGLTQWILEARDARASSDPAALSISAFSIAF